MYEETLTGRSRNNDSNPPSRTLSYEPTQDVGFSHVIDLSKTAHERADVTDSLLQP